MDTNQNNFDPQAVADVAHMLKSGDTREIIENRGYPVIERMTDSQRDDFFSRAMSQARQ